MTRAEIFEGLKKILVESEEITQEEADAAEETTDLREDLGMNSVSLLYTVIAIEDTFHIQFSDVSMGDFVTVKDVIDVIERKL